MIIDLIIPAPDEYATVIAPPDARERLAEQATAGLRTM
jgi:hypothetical protein